MGYAIELNKGANAALGPSACVQAENVPTPKIWCSVNQYRRGGLCPSVENGEKCTLVG